MRALFNFGIKQGLLPQAENPFNGAVVRPGTKKKKTLTQTQMDAMYRVMEQHLENEVRQGNSSMFNGRRNALLPAWFWLTVVNVFVIPPSAKISSYISAWAISILRNGGLT
jgi:hypothetical protein